MLKKSLKLASLIIFVFTNSSKSAEINLINHQESVASELSNKNTAEDGHINAELAELKAKVCAALAVLKCTLYKLESILTDINSAECCEDINDDTDEDDDCPSLDFDDCDDDCDESCDEETTESSSPINININCQNNEKVKIYLKLQTCKKSKQTVTK